MLSNGTQTRYKLKISGKQTTTGAPDNKHTNLQQAGWVGASEIYLGQQTHTPDSTKATARQEAELRGVELRCGETGSGAGNVRKGWPNRQRLWQRRGMQSRP